MGNVSEHTRWQHPITRHGKKKLNLVGGVMPLPPNWTNADHTAWHDLAPYVADHGSLSKLQPQVPNQKSSGHRVIRALHATLRIEMSPCELLIDPGLDVPLNGANPSIIAITHAHADHAGGLLDAAIYFPDAAIVCSSGTYELLKLLPQSNEYQTLIQNRGHVLQPDGKPFRISDVDFRLFPAGHLYGAAMLDIETSDGRFLISGDYALRETAGLPGAVWPEAEYDLLIMESTHGWDTEKPTADEEENWTGLIQACQSAIDDGFTRIVIPTAALGESQDVYYALCHAQMRGMFPDFALRLVGKAAQVAHLYQNEAPSNFDPWKHTLHTLNSQDYIPDHSVVIGSNHEAFDEEINRNLDAAAIVTPIIGNSRRSSGYVFNISLHASFRELFATAMAVRCHQVALYHGQNNGYGHQSPLAKLLQSAGRKVIRLSDTPQLLGELH